jgi:hypothetical protein
MMYSFFNINFSYIHCLYRPLDHCLLSILLLPFRCACITNSLSAPAVSFAHSGLLLTCIQSVPGRWASIRRDGSLCRPLRPPTALYTECPRKVGQYSGRWQSLSLTPAFYCPVYKVPQEGGPIFGEMAPAISGVQACPHTSYRVPLC